MAIHSIQDSNALLLYRVGPVLVCSPTMPVEAVIMPPKFTVPPGSNVAEPGMFKSLHGIVRLVDLRVRFGVDESDRSSPGKIVIAEVEGGHAGFWVDEIQDVISFPGKGWAQVSAGIPQNVFSKILIQEENIRLYADFEQLDKFKSSGYLRRYIKKIKEDLEKTQIKKNYKTTNSDARAVPIINKPDVKNRDESKKINPSEKSESIINDEIKVKQLPSHSITRSEKVNASALSSGVLSKKKKMASNGASENKEKAEVESVYSDISMAVDGVKKNKVINNTYPSNKVLLVEPDKEGKENVEMNSPPYMAFSLAAAVIVVIFVAVFNETDPTFNTFEVVEKEHVDKWADDDEVVSMQRIEIPVSNTEKNKIETELVVVEKADAIRPVVITQQDGGVLIEINNAEPLLEVSVHEIVGDDDLNVKIPAEVSNTEKEAVTTIIENDDKAIAYSVREDGVGNEVGKKEMAKIIKLPQKAETFVIKNVREKHVHIVKKGDTLWHIAKKYVNNPWRYPDLARLSHIKNPDLIYPGDRVIIIINYRQKNKNAISK